MPAKNGANIPATKNTAPEKMVPVVQNQEYL